MSPRPPLERPPLAQLALAMIAGLSGLACSEPAEPADPRLRELDLDLELHWSFEDRVGDQITDLSGNGRHGQVHGGAFVSSPQGEAVRLDGVDDYLALTHLGLRDPALYGGSDGDFTLSARVRVDDVDKLNTLCFGCGPFSSFFVGTASPGATALAGLHRQGGGSLWAASSPALADDTWRELTLVVEGGVAARYYLDCQADAELSSPDLALADYNFSVVGLGATPERWFGGEIDALRVWSRALPEQELAALCPSAPPTCAEWSSVKTRAHGLDKVWTDGADIIAIGSGDVVKRSGEEWLDIDAVTSDRYLRNLYDLWGPSPDDHWLLTKVSGDGGVARFDGSAFAEFVPFPDPPTDMGELIPRDLSGSGPSDLWAVAMANCDTFECQDPDCACNSLPSTLLHYDGLEWQEIESPGLVTQIWTDGAATWAVGGRDPDETPWLTPIGGLVASFAEGEWTVWFDDELPTLHAVWGLDGDDLWVGGEQGTLRHFALGEWSVHDLPTQASIVRIDGRASDEVWALDEDGALWAWDGAAWTQWLTHAAARDFAVYGEDLVVVGDEHGHAVDRVDTSAASVEPLYRRTGDFYPQTMVVDDMGSAVASTVSHAYSASPDPDAPASGSWRWDGASWSPTYTQLGFGFDALVGAVDQGYGTRTRTEHEPLTGFHPTYAIVDGEVSLLSPPVANMRVFDSKVFTLGGQEQLWISTESGPFFPDATHGLYALIDGAWVDRMPPGVTSLPFAMAQGGERVFVNFNSVSLVNNTWMFEGGEWTNISNPLDSSRAMSMAATGPFQLWTVQSNNTDNPEQLYFWGGAQWHRAKDLWPVLEGHEDWWTLEAVAPNDMWMLSSRSSAPESLAHWDGQGWTLVDTPALLHGWSQGPQGLLLAGAADGVFIHDGIRLWQHRSCP